MKRFLSLFSLVFHPIFFSVFGTLFYGYYTENYLVQKYFSLVLFQIVVITFLLPLTFYFLLKTIGKAENFMLPDISQRKSPLLLQLALTLVLIFKVVTIDRFSELHYFFAASCISIFAVIVLLYFKVKASIHLMAISSFTFFAIGMALHFQLNLVYFIAFCFLMCGFVAASRLSARAHTIAELAIGFGLGMLTQVSLFYFWL